MAPKIKIKNGQLRLPQSRPIRVFLGVALIIGGCSGVFAGSWFLDDPAGITGAFGGYARGSALAAASGNLVGAPRGKQEIRKIVWINNI